jgi:hypothetical protein
LAGQVQLVEIFAHNAIAGQQASGRIVMPIFAEAAIADGVRHLIGWAILTRHRVGGNLVVVAPSTVSFAV